jgi:hypothetical protein
MIWLFAAALVVSIWTWEAFSVSAAIYEWVDEGGVTHFSDVPPLRRHSTVRLSDGPCHLKQQVEDKELLEVVIILGAYLGGLDDSNRALAKKRLSEKYQSLMIPLHDLEEFCKGGDQSACACLRSITDRQVPRGFAPQQK